MSRAKQKRLWAFIVALLIIGLTFAGQQLQWFDEATQQVKENDPGTYEVVRFSDGDTIVITMNGQQETVRFIGVDTPETHDPGTPVQCYGPAASAYTKNLIGNQKVRLEADPENQNRDRYNRLLRYVYLPDDRLLQEEIIRAGYGFAYTQFPFTRSEDFSMLEADAKAHSRGLWGDCTVTETNGRKQTNPAES
jgi:endonuclease YncB( thermonuclease family)